jgi:hypothetical protein
VAVDALVRPKEMKVARASLTVGDNVSSDSVVISIRISGAKTGPGKGPGREELAGMSWSSR